MRDKYSVYFLSLLKTRNIKSIEVLNFYEVHDEDRCYICFYDNELNAHAGKPKVKKCWVFVSNDYCRTSFRLETNKTSSSIRFQWNWKKLGDCNFSIDKIDNGKIDPFLSSIFTQLLLIADNGNDIYLNNSIFISKNSSYEHSIQADLF